MKNNKTALVFFIFTFVGQAQNDLYKHSYQQLNQMIEDSTTYSFKKAVFSVENAFLEGRVDTLQFERQISFLTLLSKGLVRNRKLIYNGQDLGDVEKYAALFSVMTDSIPIISPQNETLVYTPYQYDFNDPFGNEKWENMFVTKLLETRKGNCHSLPYLYKILAEELGIEAHLALAPNHVYIKHYNQKDGWYNTELTSGLFPLDSWLMASGYVHIDAIKNGIYMKALNNQESVALCLVDLALGHLKEPKPNLDFALQCAQKALEVFPNFVNALVLKTEIKGKKLQQLLTHHGLTLETGSQLPQSQTMTQEIEKDLRHIHQLGYRQMPESMYLDWLISLRTEQEKYINKKMRTFR